MSLIYHKFCGTYYTAGTKTTVVIYMFIRLTATTGAISLSLTLSKKILKYIEGHQHVNNTNLSFFFK